MSSPLARMQPPTPVGFRSQANWDVLLSSDVKLSKRFETVARMIYGIGFTCVVIMGINKFTKEVCHLILFRNIYFIQNVAVKVIMKSKLHSHEDLERAVFELNLHAKLTHRNVIPFLGGEETQDSVIIVTPLAKGDLNSLSLNKVFSEGNCRRLSRQLLEGLEYIHSLNLVHGDVKPHNILLFLAPSGRYVAKICDFGFSEKLREGDTTIPFQTMRGSLGYFSPEQLGKRPYGQGIDMFALGIIIYTLMCGYEPFYPSNRAGLLKGEAEADSKILLFDSPYWDCVSNEGVSFLKGLLHGNAALRYTASQALRSKWMSQPDNNNMMTSTEDADIQFE